MVKLFHLKCILILANKCLTVLVGLLGHNISVCCVKLVGFVNSQLGCNHYLSYDLLKSALHLIEVSIFIINL